MTWPEVANNILERLSDTSVGILVAFAIYWALRFFSRRRAQKRAGGSLPNRRQEDPLLAKLTEAMVKTEERWQNHLETHRGIDKNIDQLYSDRNEHSKKLERHDEAIDTLKKTGT